MEWTERPLGEIIIHELKRMVGWGKPLPPDPWPEELSKAVYGPDARYVCHHCFTPQDGCGWFCPECGAATGPYNNWTAYIYIFSTGEIYRAGTSARIRLSPFVTGTYIFMSIFDYGIFAPVYWFRLHRNLKRCQQLDLLDEDDGTDGDATAESGEDVPPPASRQ